MRDDAPQALRQVVTHAEAESRRLRHGYIGSEHLLLGLLRTPESRATRLLAAAGVDHSRVQDLVTRIVGHGEEPYPPDMQVPFTPNAAGVIGRVGRESGREAIGTEHVLRAILRRRDSVAVRVVSDLGVDPGAMADGLRRPNPDG